MEYSTLDVHDWNLNMDTILVLNISPLVVLVQSFDMYS